MHADYSSDKSALYEDPGIGEWCDITRDGHVDIICVRTIKGNRIAVKGFTMSESVI